MSKSLVLTVLSSIVLSFPAMADLEGPECDPAGSMMEMKMCAGESLSDSDKELNDVYKLVVASMKNGPEKDLVHDNLQALKKAQRAWIVFRDAECELQTIDSMGGSIYSLELTGCIEEMTIKRTEQLKLLLNPL